MGFPWRRHILELLSKAHDSVKNNELLIVNHVSVMKCKTSVLPQLIIYWADSMHPHKWCTLQSWWWRECHSSRVLIWVLSMVLHVVTVLIQASEEFPSYSHYALQIMERFQVVRKRTGHKGQLNVNYKIVISFFFAQIQLLIL